MPDRRPMARLLVEYGPARGGATLTIRTRDASHLNSNGIHTIGFVTTPG
jgi:hypothetical protein